MAVTNADLMRAILENHQAAEARFDRLEKKVDLTNGRVTRLELARARADGIKSVFAWGPATLTAILGGVATGAILYYMF